jgi:hypothetical protein
VRLWIPPCIEPDADVFIDIKKGGNMIDYPNEDPEIRLRYEAALKERGITSQMPKV